MNMIHTVEFPDANNHWQKQRFETEDEARKAARQLRRFGYRDVEVVTKYKEISTLRKVEGLA